MCTLKMTFRSRRFESGVVLRLHSSVHRSCSKHLFWTEVFGGNTGNYNATIVLYGVYEISFTQSFTILLLLMYVCMYVGLGGWGQGDNVHKHMYLRNIHTTATYIRSTSSTYAHSRIHTQPLHHVHSMIKGVDTIHSRSNRQTQTFALT